MLREQCSLLSHEEWVPWKNLGAPGAMLPPLTWGVGPTMGPILHVKGGSIAPRACKNYPLSRLSELEKKKIKNCGVLSLKMAQRAKGHTQPILFLSIDMDQNEILLNKIRGLLTGFFFFFFGWETWLLSMKQYRV